VGLATTKRLVVPAAAYKAGVGLPAGSWPVTRSTPVGFVLQALLPPLTTHFLAASGFGPVHGAPLAISLLVVSARAAAVGAPESVARVAG
jgi:hypothetical protein